MDQNIATDSVAATDLRARNFSAARLAAILLGISLIASGTATMMVLTGYGPLRGEITTAIWLVNLDLVLALALIAVLARRIVRSFIDRRMGSAGSKLHVRLVASFSLVAVIPSLLVAAFAGIFLNFGIETWFSDRVRTAVNESKQVAEAYLLEHQENIGGSALAMANDINRAATRYAGNPRILGEILQTQSIARELSEAVVVDKNGNTLLRTGFGFSLEFNVVSQGLLSALTNSRSGEVVIFRGGRDDRVLAGVRLEAFEDAYLLVGRFVKQQVLEHLSTTRGATAQYAELEKNRESLQFKFLLIFGMVALLLLLAAIWIGWSLATQLSTPIGNLIYAAERVRKGDLDAKVDIDESIEKDEIGTLSLTFNRMTDQLENQRNGLIEANKELDERRQFTETVLAGVSAGVIGLDRAGLIHLSNRSATELLGIELQTRFTAELTAVVPEMADLFDAVRRQPNRTSQGEITLSKGGRNKTLLVSVAAEQINGNVVGYVVTFDDVTELLSAQRKAAWADVARRIAHEIKNPLTPIQLSAERLRRKYLKEITSDPETFSICTDTIVRQVEDIGRMVDEFSSFARMPRPDLKSVDLTEICRRIAIMEENREENVDYDVDLPESEVRVTCDREQVSRALTNILKNAAEALDGKTGGKISLSLRDVGEYVLIEITDNGKGFPADLIDRITEPYVTTREKGTGLGLAISKKIMEDHGGDLIVENGPDGGAHVVLQFSKSLDISAEPGIDHSESNSNNETVTGLWPTTS
jgi:two-component system nitrogen regulation sensor histidine kinase NtrY